MREATAWPYPTLTDELYLPATSNGAAPSARETLQGWARFSDAQRVLFAPNLRTARRVLLDGVRPSQQTRVLLPPNATHDLVETVKESGASIGFGQLDAELCLQAQGKPDLLWLQPPLGLPGRSAVQAAITVLDHGDTLPGGAPLQAGQRGADVAIFGLHLSTDAEQSGALLVFANETLYESLQDHRDGLEADFYCRAARQLARLSTLAHQQYRALDAVWMGVHAAAGLPSIQPNLPGALPHGVALRIPREGSAATFWHYAQGENTPVLWLAQVRPIHYAALHVAGPSAGHLERWLVAPVGPRNDLAANKQTVLGIVKTAEFLGLRWRIEPARAARYAALLVEKYGPDHDAYRPAFATNEVVTAEDAQARPPMAEDISAQDLFAPACRIPSTSRWK